MYHHIRRVFRKQPNSYKLHRTISGLDKKHIESRRYIDPKNTKLTELRSSLKFLNNFGEDVLSRYSAPIDDNTCFVNLWCGGLWYQTKTPHLSYQRQSSLSVLSKANNPPPASQKNSSSPPSKSSP